MVVSKKINFLGLQETHQNTLSVDFLSNLWGKRSFNFAEVEAQGKPVEY